MLFTLKVASGRPLSAEEKQRVNDFTGNEKGEKLTPLMWASKSGLSKEVREAAVKGLLKEGADVNIRHPTSGETACSFALRDQHSTCAQILIEAGAEIPKDALHNAVRYGRIEILSLLLRHLKPGDLNTAQALPCGNNKQVLDISVF
eukprot:g98.t1